MEIKLHFLIFDMNRKYKELPGIISGKYKVETKTGLKAEYYKRVWNGTSWIYWFKIFWKEDLSTLVAYFAGGNEVVGSEFMRLVCIDTGLKKGLLWQTILVNLQDILTVLRKKIKKA